MPTSPFFHLWPGKFSARAAALVTVGILLLAPGVAPAQQRAIRPDLKDLAYGTESPGSQALDVYFAKGSPQQNPHSKPAVVYLHGGGWRAGSKDPIPRFLQLGLEQGLFHVIAVEYRFTTIAPHPAQAHDCVRAIQFVRAHAGEWRLDPARIAVTGGSAGAHLSLWVGLHDDLAQPQSDDPIRRQSSRVALILAFAGPTDWRLLSTLEHRHPAYRQILGYEPGTPASALDPDKTKDVSPVSFVSADDPPVYLFHGEADDVVPIQHAQVMEQQLKQAGVKYELLTLPGAGHEVAGAAAPILSSRALHIIREQFHLPEP